MKPVVKLFTYVSLTIITMVMFWSIFDKLFGDTVGLLFAFTLTPITAYLVYLIANKISLQPKPNYMVFSLIVTLVICLIATIIPKSQGLPYAEMAIKHIKNSPEEMNEYYDYIKKYNDRVEDLKKAIRFEIVEKFESEAQMEYIPKIAYTVQKINLNHISSEDFITKIINPENEHSNAIIGTKLTFVGQVKASRYGAPLDSKFYVIEADLRNNSYSFWYESFDENPSETIIKMQNADKEIEKVTKYRLDQIMQKVRLLFFQETTHSTHYQLS